MPFLLLFCQRESGGEFGFPGGIADYTARCVSAVAEFLGDELGEDVGVVVGLFEFDEVEVHGFAVGLAEEGGEAALVGGVEERWGCAAGDGGGGHWSVEDEEIRWSGVEK